MCLGIVARDPHRLLARGEHAGHEWQVVHNDRGHRCGYVKVSPGHPWHGKHYDDIEAEIHGGLTFSEDDEPCPLDGPDDGYWVGFDCAHAGDAPDPSLPQTESIRNVWPAIYGDVASHRGTVRTQEYAEAECRSLCEQASAASTRTP